MFMLETKRGQALFLFGIFILAVVVRLPLILNANALFNSDHAVNALTIKHLFENGEFQLYYYGIRYQGLVESLLVAPILIAGQFMPLSWFIGATVVHLLFIFIFWACSKEFCEDKRVPFWVALFLAITPFAYTYWSTDSVMGGHCAVCIWFILLLYVSKKREPGFSFAYDVIMAGFIVVGLYHYRLFQVYLPSIFLLLFIKAFKSGKQEDGRWSFKPFFHLTVVLFLTGLGLLLVSKWADFTDYSVVYPDYSAIHVLKSVLLLPEKFLANIPLYKDLLLYMSGDTYLVVTAIVICLSLTSFLFCRRNRMIQFLLANSVLFSLLTFFIAPDMYVDRMSDRYILHIYPIVILTMVNALYGISFRWKYLRWPVYGFLVCLLCANGYNNYREYAPHGCSWEYRPLAASPYYRLAQFLKAQGVTHGKADYWTAYATTYFSDEQTIVTSNTIVRYPPYRDEVDESAEIGYIKRKKIKGFPLEPLQFEGFFVYRAGNRGRPEKGSVSGADLEMPARQLLSNFFSVWDKETAAEDFQLYLSILRAAQCEGLETVISQAQEMVRGFLVSEKGVPRNDTIYVTQLYDGVLGRKASKDETVYWVDLLKHKKYTRDEALATFFHSAEFRNRAKQIVAAGCGG